MAAFWIYLKLELKRACRILPCFLSGAVVLALLLGTIALLASKALYGETAAGRIAVGVVIAEDDLTSGRLISMLSSMDSVESLCDFVEVSEEEGRRQVENGQLDTLILMPPMMLQSIMSGENTPAVLVLPDGGGLETMIFRSLTSAGARTLAVSQAGIYAADEFALNHGLADEISHIEQELNARYLSYAMSRSGAFRSRQVSAAGDLTTAQFYAVSAAVMFLLLCGIPAALILKPEPAVWTQKLRSLGIGPVGAVFVKLCCVWFLLTAGLVCVAGLIGVTGLVGGSGSAGGSGLAVSGFSGLAFSLFPGLRELGIPGTLAVLAAASLWTASWIVPVYELAQSLSAGVMVWFLGSVSMVFAAGGVIPSVFLPEGIRRAAAFLPGTWLTDWLRALASGQMSAGAGLLLTAAFPVVLGAAAAGRRLKSE